LKAVSRCKECTEIEASDIEITTSPTSAKKQIVVDSALCKGCGICFATCPKEGIMVHGFTMNELKSQVRAAIAEDGMILM